MLVSLLLVIDNDVSYDVFTDKSQTFASVFHKYQPRNVTKMAETRKGPRDNASSLVTVTLREHHAFGFT